MAKYAAGTTASVENSRAEIERVLRRYGADGVVVGWQGQQVVLRFKAHHRFVQFNMTIPISDDKQFWRDGRGVSRTPAQRRNAAEAEERRLWRCLLLAIKAKLEVVDSGIATFEEEFASHIVLPDGSQVGEWLLPQLQAAYDCGSMPEFLPGTQRALTTGS